MLLKQILQRLGPQEHRAEEHDRRVEERSGRIHDLQQRL